MLVSYSQKEKKKETELFHIHDHVLKSLAFPKGRKVIIIIVNPFIQGPTCTFIHLCTQCVWYVPSCLTVQVDPTRLPPSPPVTQTYTDL